MRVRRLAAADAAIASTLLTRRRSIVRFVGAGISASSGLPLAREVKAAMFSRLARDIVPTRGSVFEEWQQKLDGVMLESLVEVFARGLPSVPQRFASLFRTGTPNEAHHALVEQLATRKCVAVITTNFDDLVERAYEMRRRLVPSTQRLAVIRTRNDKWDGRRPLLIKLHGCVRVPHTITITLRRVGKGLEHWKRDWLHKLSAYPFVVTGYSDQDKDISPVLKKLTNDWIWFLHSDRTIEAHVPAGSQLREMLSGSRRTVFVTNVSEALTAGAHLPMPVVATRTMQRTWLRAIEQLVARIPTARRHLLLGDILSELLGDDSNADIVYRRGLARRELSRSLRVAFYVRRLRLRADTWELDRMEQLYRGMLRAVAPLKALSARDRASIERAHATLLSKRGTRLSQEAEEALQRAESLSGKSGDRESVAFAQMNRAVVCQKRGRYKVAEPLYEKALRAFRRQGNLAAVAKTLVNYGSVLGMTGRNKLALRAYREGADVFEMIGDPLWAARLRVNMAIVLRELRQLKRALPVAIAARSVIRRHGDRYWTFNAEEAVSNIRRDLRYGWRR